MSTLVNGEILNYLHLRLYCESFSRENYFSLFADAKIHTNKNEKKGMLYLISISIAQRNGTYLIFLNKNCVRQGFSTNLLTILSIMREKREECRFKFQHALLNGKKLNYVSVYTVKTTKIIFCVAIICQNSWPVPLPASLCKRLRGWGERFKAKEKTHVERKL